MTAVRSNSPSMARARVTLLKWTGLVLAALAVATLGNLRSQAAEIDPHRSSPAVQGVAQDGVPVTRAALARRADAADEGDDALRVVPAIYARNPGVRYVYFRHVSRWM